jgi:VanZ family protein
MGIVSGKSNDGYLWPILLTIAIFVASGTSNLATPDLGLEFSKDKIGHFLVFGLLATSILRTPAFKSGQWPKLLTAILLTSAIGAADEFRQSFTPGRSVELADWIADTAGAIVAVLVYARWKIYRDLLEWSKKKTGQTGKPHRN